MNIKRTEIAQLVFPYAVSIFDCTEGKKVVIGTELQGQCLGIAVDSLDTQVLWENKGGTMNVCQLNADGDFLAVQEFYKGFNSKTACIAKVINQDGQWISERYISLPYVHRFCVIDVENEKYLLASTLCGDKDFKDDWSKPGSVYLGRLPENLDEPCALTPLIGGITKNHGLFKGVHNGKQVVLITGQQGVFEIFIPERACGTWEYKHIMQNEVSDLTVLDIDGDGVEEIVTIEGFHGSRIVIYKPVPEGFQAVYSFPVDFGHVIWGGTVLGKPSLLVGYRGANGALLMMRVGEKRGDDFMMDITFVDEHEAPTNIDVCEKDGVCKIFACSGGKNRVMLYELS